jgi:putative oxidoreductase
MTRRALVGVVVLRVGAGLLFMQHGAQKLFGVLGGFGGAGHTAPMMSRFGVAGVLELVGGALIAAGVLTRPVAAVLAVEMIIAFATAHFPRGGAPVENGGELALLYALIFVLLASVGAGPFSVDDAIFGRRD